MKSPINPEIHVSDDEEIPKPEKQLTKIGLMPCAAKRNRPTHTKTKSECGGNLHKIEIVNKDRRQVR